MRRSEAQDLNSVEHLKGVVSPQRVFQEIGLTVGASLLDVGCGEGRFSLAASEIVEKGGMVYALDISEERVAALQQTVIERNLGNVRAFVADVTEHVCVDEDVIDVCLMANVFHELVEDGAIKGELGEIKRPLKPDGKLAIVDFKKDVQPPPGPPPSRRLDPAEVVRIAERYGFKSRRICDVGSYHYLVVFSLCTVV